MSDSRLSKTGEVQACPDRDTTDIRPRTQSRDWRCKNCGLIFQEPIRRRPAKNPQKGDPE